MTTSKTTTWSYRGGKGCIHQDWLKVGNKDKGEYSVFLRSTWGSIPKLLDVYFDLRGLIQRGLPPKYTKYLGDKTFANIIPWYIEDGDICETLPGIVVGMLKDGLSVGWGCEGGHGRTGWLAAKVHQLITGCSGLNTVTHVRKNYCTNAIETKEQEDDLGYESPSVFEKYNISKTGECNTHKAEGYRIVNDKSGSVILKELKAMGYEKLNPECLRDDLCEECEYFTLSKLDIPFCWLDKGDLGPKLNSDDGSNWERWEQSNCSPLRLHENCLIEDDCFECHNLAVGVGNKFVCTLTGTEME